MKKNPYYSLQMLSGTPNLIPFGQAVADLRPGVQLGGCGELLWSLSDKCKNRNELIQLAVSRMDISGSQRAEAEADIQRFLTELTALGILIEDDPLETAAGSAPFYSVLKTGPLLTALRGRSDFFHPDFAPFLIMDEDDAHADLTVTVSEHVPPDHAGMICLLRNAELEVYQGECHIILRFPTMPDITTAMLSEDGKMIVYYIRSDYEAERLQIDLFHAIRHGILYAAQRRGLFVLHAVSVLYRDRAWLFSAPAGTGKSTHAMLWKDCFGTPVLNGDLAMLSVSDRGPLLHPIPWCGTSGIATNETHPLGGVVFLRRGQNNSANVLPPEKRQLRLANRLISPVWTESQLLYNLAFAADMSEQTGMWELACTAEPEAVFCMKAAIDRFLEEGPIHG